MNIRAGRIADGGRIDRTRLLTFTFDGKDDAGHALASGTYFARLRIGTDVMQVRKMSLVK